MIFVTVGSVAPFDELVKMADELAGKGWDVTAQIGNGKYAPKNLKWFRFEKDLSRYYKAADVVIAHTGAGTLFEIIREGKKAVAIPNPHVIANHELAERLAQEGYIIFCREVSDLDKIIMEMKSWAPKRYVEERCLIPEIIKDFLLGSPKEQG